MGCLDLTQLKLAPIVIAISIIAKLVAQRTNFPIAESLDIYISDKLSHIQSHHEVHKEQVHLRLYHIVSIVVF